MPTGDITASVVGVFNLSGAALITSLSTLNVGGATQGASTADIALVPHGNGQVSVIKLLRAA